MSFKNSTLVSDIKNTVVGKPYLATTQNLGYIPKLCPAPEKAFTILGSGDSVFQLVYSGAKRIEAVDANEEQFRVFSLRRAAIMALEYKDFCDFLLRPYGKKFLSRGIFERVLPHFQFGENETSLFWKDFFGAIKITDIVTYKCFFRGGIEFCGNETKKSLAYIKDLKAYNQLKANLKAASIRLHHDDAIDFLIRNGLDYDWVDISNILIYYYQCVANRGPDIFEKNLRRLAEAWNDSANNPSSTMVLDYMFGIGKHELENGTMKSRTARSICESGLLEIYDRIFTTLTANFGQLQIMEVRELADAMPTKGPMDSVIYVTGRPL